MKKKLFIFLLMLIITGVFVCQSTVYVKANEIEYDVLTPEVHQAYLEESLDDETTYSSGITEYHSYLASYYDNLTYNLGMNYKGSCGYVALAMLLSYYDTFLDDGIIPEQYDITSNGYETSMVNRRNSPGVVRDIISNPNNLSDSSYGYGISSYAYYNNISSLVNTSLHAKLVSIGAASGYYNFSNNASPAGTNFSIRLNVLNNYLSSFLDYDSTDYTLSYLNYESNSSKSNDVKNFAIEKVRNGQPVLLSIGGIKGGHVVVAYDYNESTNELYCHFGWGANKTHVTIESEGFNRYKTALAISFNDSHSHSNNYGVTTITGGVPTTSYYCFDSSMITLVNHSYSPWEYYNRSLHSSICSCGKQITSPHVVSATATGRFKPCLECGYLLDTNYDIGIVGPFGLNLMVTSNGSYILPSGIIVLVDEDIDAYFNDTLVFYQNGTIIS